VRPTRGWSKTCGTGTTRFGTSHRCTGRSRGDTRARWLTYDEAFEILLGTCDDSDFADVTSSCCRPLSFLNGPVLEVPLSLVIVQGVEVGHFSHLLQPLLERLRRIVIVPDATLRRSLEI